MQSRRAAPTRFGRCALGTQRASSAYCAVKPEALQLVGAASEIGSRRHGRQMPSHLPGGTGAASLDQVNDEVILGEMLTVGLAGQSGRQLAPSVGKVLAGAAVAVGGVAHSLHHRHTGAGLALFHQAQMSQALPGSTSAAVINWLLVPPPRRPCARQSGADCSCGHDASTDHAPSRSGPCPLHLSGSPHRQRHR